MLCEDPDRYGKLISEIFELKDIHEALQAAMDKNNIKVILKIN